ncbi:MAG TPA: cytochrome-c peroxidase, partial [Saprospiraceae bacterium]|nr:cytochrome-c peroxidase [Saprospiraceae bacterium]
MKTSSMMVILTAALALFVACDKETDDGNPISDILNLPATPYNYTAINLPAHLTTNALLGPGQNAAVNNDNTPASNPTTNEGATLGRVLFYDKKLSANGTVSCASCHKQEQAFSDNARLSLGFSGGTTRRHSMSLVNARWY